MTQMPPRSESSSETTLAVIDLGNTRVHCGFVVSRHASSTQQEKREVEDIAHFPTSSFENELEHWLSSRPCDGIAWCSVVPARNVAIESCIQTVTVPSHHLTWDRAPGLPITYPTPREIGEDRLANAIAAQVLAPGKAVVVLDAGTAVTYDLVTPKDGYLGGFIAPGLALMTDYLHEKTAQLPQVPLDALNRDQPFGRSTRESMALACAVGFTGMIRALTERVLSEMEKRGYPDPVMLATGGSTRHLLPEPERWAYHPDLTLLGLAEVWHRARVCNL